MPQRQRLIVAVVVLIAVVVVMDGVAVAAARQEGAAPGPCPTNAVAVEEAVEERRRVLLQAWTVHQKAKDPHAMREPNHFLRVLAAFACIDAGRTAVGASNLVDLLIVFLLWGDRP